MEQTKITAKRLFRKSTKDIFPVEKGFYMSNMILHKGAKLVDVETLARTVTPEGDSTWKPVPHSTLLTCVKESLTSAGIHIKEEKHALGKDGLRYFGLLTLSIIGRTMKDFEPTVGLVNANDKSKAAGVCCGSHVFVCDNMAFTAEFKVHRKHTLLIHSALPMLVDRVISKVLTFASTQDTFYNTLKGAHIQSDKDVHDFVIKALDKKVISATKIPDILKEYRTPSFPDFNEYKGTLWSLLNAITYIEKKRGVNPFNLPAKHVILHGMLQEFETRCVKD